MSKIISSKLVCGKWSVSDSGDGARNAIVRRPRVCSRRMSGGYTLIELVGVLTIVTILAAVVTENVLEKMKLTTRQTEAANLANFSKALTDSIVHTKAVPATTAWAGQIANELSLPQLEVQTTKSGNTRYIVIDPAFRVGTNDTATIPYTQTVAGSVEPLNCRAVIVSSTGIPIPSELIASTTFENFWGVAENSVPANWPVEWRARAQDIKVERVELAGLFHRIVLSNLDAFREAPYSIESTNTLTTVPIGGRKEAWYIDSTALNLHLPDSTIQAREFIHEDVSYVFENGRWGRYLNSGSNALLGLFGQMVDAFLAANPPPDPKFYADQQAVVDELYNYLWYLGIWADEGFPPDANPAHPQIPEFRVATDAQDRLSDFSANLVK